MFELQNIPPGLYILATVFAVGAAVAFVIRWHLDGPDSHIVVVDRRTYKLAQKRIEAAVAAKDYPRAQAGAYAMEIWLRGEIRTGPSRRRIEYAFQLEQVQLLLEQIEAALYPPAADIEANR